MSGVGDIYQVAHASTTPIKLASGQYLPDFWVDDPGSTPDGMYLKPLDGGATVTLTQNEIHPKIATDGTWLYYTDQSYVLKRYYTDQSYVLKRSADGSSGNVQKLYTTTYPDGIALDATHVYWIDRTDDAVYRGDKSP